MTRKTKLAGAVCALLTSTLLSIPAGAKPMAARNGILTAEEGGFDYAVQGEYHGKLKNGAYLGAQVIALGNGAFQAVFYPGGLPGAGWDKQGRFPVDGKRSDESVVFGRAEGAKKYMGKSAAEFSALDPPPVAQPDYTAAIAKGVLHGKTADGNWFELKRAERKSPTLGESPPRGAKVLLAYEPGKAPDLSGWSNKKWRAMPDGSMLVVHVDKTNPEMSASAVHFGDRSYRLHLEFRTSFMPGARSQARANSGVFPPTGREVQVLDSFGLEGKPNECGGIYKTHASAVNMCLPPLAWQTYDIYYTSATDAADNKAFYKVVHNGVTIHDRVELAGAGKPGPLRLQDHLNNIFYRNIWVMEK